MNKHVFVIWMTTFPSLLVACWANISLGFQFEGDPEDYVVVAKIWRSNIKLIRTWQGTAKVVVEKPPAKEGKYQKSHQTGITDFAYARDGQRFRRDTSLEIRSKANSDPAKVLQFVDLLIPEGYYSLGNASTDDQRQPTTLVVKPGNALSVSLFSASSFHPLTMTTYYPRCV